MRLTFAFIAFLKTFSSSILTMKFEGNTAADINDGIRARDETSRLRVNSVSFQNDGLESYSLCVRVVLEVAGSTGMS